MLLSEDFRKMHSPQRRLRAESIPLPRTISKYLPRFFGCLSLSLQHPNNYVVPKNQSLLTGSLARTNHALLPHTKVVAGWGGRSLGDALAPKQATENALTGSMLCLFSFASGA